MRTRVRVKGTSDYVTPPAGAVGQLAGPGHNRGPAMMDAGAADGGSLVQGVSDDVRPYETAGGSGRRSMAYRPMAWGPNASISYGLQELRNKSRDLTRKNGFARSIVTSQVTNIVGRWIKPRSTASNQGFREQFDRVFLDWTDEADAIGALDFYGLMALATHSMIEGGESFTRLRYRRRNDGLTVPLQLQVMEGEQCPHALNWGVVSGTDVQPLAGNTVMAGIEFNPIGARVAYWMLQEHPGDATYGLAFPTTPVRIPANLIAHLHRARRPGQARGEPWLTPALSAIQAIGQYLDAEIDRKKTSAMLVGFIKRAADAIQPLGSDPPDATGTSSLTMEPGTIQVLEDGEEIDFSDPKDVGNNFEAFLREAKRSVAVATDALYEFVSGDYSSLNDRTLRAAFNNYKRAVGMYQSHLVVFQWCRPIIKAWMDQALLSGAMTVPAGMDPKEAYRFEWIPDGWEYIHPVQDVEGKILQVSAGFTSRTTVAASQGDDAAEIDKQQAMDNQRADAAKLTYTSDGRQKVTSGATSPPPANNDQ